MRHQDELNAVVPIGSITDELDIFKVLLSRGFGFSLWWSCWDCGYSSLKHKSKKHERFSTQKEEPCLVIEKKEQFKISLLYFHKWLVKFTLLYVSESTSCLKSYFKLIRWLKIKSIKLIKFLFYFHRFLFNTPSLYTHVNWIICLWGFWVSTIIAAELSHFYNETQGSMTRRKRNRGGQRKRQQLTS